MRRSRPAPRLAVVIPTLNEAQSLPRLLDDLSRQSLALEVIVADGGSTDTTAECARAARARWVAAPRGRGAQMNAGARSARAGCLLFLHADSRLVSSTQLAEAMAALDRECASGDDAVAGHFALRFDRKRPGHEPLFRFMEAKSRTNRDGTINGDQGLLLTRAYFERLGGYDTRWPFFEDQRIARRIFSTGRWVLLPGELRTSARRFEREGHERRYALMGLMMLMHEAGLKRFFDEAPAVYAAQDRAAALRLGPFVRIARRLLIRNLLADPGVLLRCGGFLRRNAWQLALALDLMLNDPDVASGQNAQDWQRRFDRGLAERLDRPTADGLAGLIAAALLFAPGLSAALESLSGGQG